MCVPIISLISLTIASFAQLTEDWAAERRDVLGSIPRAGPLKVIKSLHCGKRLDLVSDEHYVTKILPPTGTLKRGP